MTGDIHNSVGKLARRDSNLQFKDQVLKLAKLHSKLSVLLAGSGPLQEVLQTSCQHSVDVLDFELSQVWLADQQEQTLQLAAEAGRTSGSESKIPIANSRVGSIASGREPLLCNQPTLADSLGVGDPSWLSDAGIVAFGGYPMMVDRRLIGVVTWFAKSEISTDVFDQLQPMADAIANFVARIDSDRILKDQASELRLALDTGRLGTWKWDTQSDHVTWSAQLYEMFGFTERQFVPTSEGFLAIIHPDDRDYVRQRLDCVFPGQCEAYKMEFRIIRGDDQRTVWTVGRGVISRDQQGYPLAITAVAHDITERKEAELKLAEREADLRRVIDNMLGLVGILATDGTLLDANTTALVGGGLEREDVIGKKFWECYWWDFDRDTANRLKDSIERAASGEVSRYDVEVRMKDDTRMMIDFMIAPVRDETGQVSYLIPSGVDITDRVKAEQAQNDNERRLKMALSAGGMAAWEWTPNHSVWTDALYELLGLSANEHASPETFFRRVHPLDQTDLQQSWQDATAGEKPYSHEFRIVRPDGEIRWLAAAGEFERDQHGEVTRIYGLNWDITERKKADLRKVRTAKFEHFLLQASNVLTSSLDYEQTLASVTDLCVPTLADWAFIDLIDEDGSSRRVHVAHVDPADRKLAAEVSKYAAKPQFTNHPPAKGLFGGETLLIPEFTNEMLIKAAQNDEHQAVMRAVNPKSLIVVPLMSRMACLGALTLITSESGRRYMKRDLKIAKELAQQAATAVDNARLFNEAQQANIAKSEFLANMSHEIRTPMTSVLGYAELLRERIDDSEAGQHLAIIRRNGEFLLDIINDILDLSKIEAGKLEITPERFDLARLIEDVRSVMEVRAKERGLRLEIQYLNKIPVQIESDPKRLKQILINLVGNAIKFTRQGEVRLQIRFEADKPQPLQIKIVDTGIGIALEKQKQLFKPFSQGDASVAREFGGTGLGLVISRRLASLLGGDIDVKSSVDQGSEFTVSLAVGNISDIPIMHPKAPIEATKIGTQTKELVLTSHILVVDDRRDIRFLSKQLLNKAGASVDEAEDGMIAVKHIRGCLDSGKLPDLILLDMQMPNLDGYQTAQQVRAIGYKGPIIALTADAMQGDMKRCIECGCNAYLSKPIDAHRLVELVHELTRNHAAD